MVSSPRLVIGVNSCRKMTRWARAGAVSQGERLCNSKEGTVETAEVPSE